MDLLTLILPVVGGALVWAYNAYTKKTGTDPLANKPLLKMLFDLLSKTMPAHEQVKLATELGINNDPDLLHRLIMNAENRAWEAASNNKGFADMASLPAPAAPIGAAVQVDDKIVHLPIRISIRPEFLHPEADEGPLPPEAPAVKLAA